MREKMSQQKLQEVVYEIRSLAKLNEFDILRGNKKEPWKNKLLDAISNDAVRNHLMCLHPFQYYKYGDTVGVMEFKVNWYANDIYLKVNLQTREVLSFHYDEGLSRTENNVEMAFSTMHVIADKKYYRDFVNFAIGSTITSVPVDIMYDDDGTQWIMELTYSEAIKGVARKAQLAAIRKISSISEALAAKLIGPAKDYGFLSYTEGQLRLISTCYDIWRNNTSDVWLSDMMLDLIFQQDEKTQKQFAEQLYKDMPDLPLTREFLKGRG